MLVCLVHGYILFLKLRHMCDGLVKFDPCACLCYAFVCVCTFVSASVHAVCVLCVCDSPVVLCAR